MENQIRDLFNADTSLSEPELDELNYADYARHVANAIVSNAPDEGIVFAVHGKWGTGKTTFIDFIKSYVKTTEIAPVVIEFNPWWFTGKESLIRGFFNTFADEISKETDCPWRLVEDLKKLSNLITAINPPGWLGAVARAFSWVLSQTKNDVPTIKDQIRQAILRYSKRFLIVMDDVDRLTADEIVEVIRLIKSVADFPKVTYLLAFDKEEVSRAINEKWNSHGNSFLEKIIQVPIELPVLEPDDLSDMFINSLQKFLNKIPNVNFQHERWNDLYHQGIRKLLTKPRDTTRIINALRINYPEVMHEVDVVDFIFIETIRVIHPELYQVIRSNQDRFAGMQEHANKENDIRFHEMWLNQFSEDQQETLRTVMQFVFPRLQSVWANYIFSYEDEVQWTRNLRICSRERCPVYFRFGVPSNQISNEEVQLLLASADSYETFEGQLLNMSEGTTPDGKTRCRKVLVKLDDHVVDIPTRNVSIVVVTLCKLSHELLNRDRQFGFYEVQLNYILSRVLWRLVNRLPKNERLPLIEKATEQSTSLLMILNFASHMEYDVGKMEKSSELYSGEKLGYSSGDVADIRRIFANRAQEFANSGRLVSQHALPYILNEWTNISGNEQPSTWSTSLLGDDENFIPFLKQFISIAHSQTLGSVNVLSTKQVDTERLQKYVDLKAVDQRLVSMSQNELSAEEMEVLELYHEALKARSASRTEPH